MHVKVNIGASFPLSYFIIVIGSLILLIKYNGITIIYKHACVRDMCLA